MRQFVRSCVVIGCLIPLGAAYAQTPSIQGSGFLRSVGSAAVNSAAAGPTDGTIGLSSDFSEPSLNLAATFAETKLQLETGGRAEILVLGDSLSLRAGGWLPFFRERMQIRYGNAGYGYQGFGVWTGAGLNSGWTSGRINEDTPPHFSLDGLWAESNQGPARPAEGVFTSAIFQAKDSSIVLHYLEQPLGGRVEITDASSGALLVQLDTAGISATLRTWSHTFTSPSQTIRLQPLDQGRLVTILGQINQSSLSGSGVVIHRCANGGWGVDNFLQRGPTFDEQIQLIDPSLIMIWLGQNDQGNSYAAYVSKINALADRVLAASPGAELLLMGAYDSGSPNLIQLVNAMHDVALNRSFGFVNLFEVAGSHEFLIERGFLDSDEIHFAPAGGQWISNIMFDAFESDGASLRSPCVGDADADRTIAFSDIAMVVAHWLDNYGVGSTGPGDANIDGIVDFNDITAVVANWLNICP